MRLYDFSSYKRKRDERLAAKAVIDVAENLRKPGAVVELKTKINTWFELHRQITRKAS
jgi:hypothetical protein